MQSRIQTPAYELRAHRRRWMEDTILQHVEAVDLKWLASLPYEELERKYLALPAHIHDERGHL